MLRAGKALQHLFFNYLCWQGCGLSPLCFFRHPCPSGFKGILSFEGAKKGWVFPDLRLISVNVINDPAKKSD